MHLSCNLYPQGSWFRGDPQLVPVWNGGSAPAHTVWECLLHAACFDSILLSGARKTPGVGYLRSQMAQGFSALKAKVVFEGQCGVGDSWLRVGLWREGELGRKGTRWWQWYSGRWREAGGQRTGRFGQQGLSFSPHTSWWVSSIPSCPSVLWHLSTKPTESGVTCFVLQTAPDSVGLVGGCHKPLMQSGNGTSGQHIGESLSLLALNSMLGTIPFLLHHLFPTQVWPSTLLPILSHSNSSSFSPFASCLTIISYSPLLSSPTNCQSTSETLITEFSTFNILLVCPFLLHITWVEGEIQALVFYLSSF